MQSQKKRIKNLLIVKCQKGRRAKGAAHPISANLIFDAINWWIWWMIAAAPAGVKNWAKNSFGPTVTAGMQRMGQCGSPVAISFFVRLATKKWAKTWGGIMAAG